ncbi:MAG TPA: ATP-binding protein [Chloroflexota bacterium]|nr:ATP-binding protein [Chloroflexota bacterium]
MFDRFRNRKFLLYAVLLIGTSLVISQVQDPIPRAIGVVSLVIVAIIGLARAEARVMHSERFATIITETARRFSSGDLEARVRTDEVGSLGELALALNEVATQIQMQISAVSAERNMLSSVLGALADGVVMTDRSGRVVLVNRAAANLLEVDEFSISSHPDGGKPFIEVVRDYELDRLLRDALALEVSREATLRVGASGRMARAIASPMSGTGDLTGLLVLQDFTEVRRAEQIRREFVANISHELRTPIASLKALVETLEEGALEDPPAAREFVGRMHVEVDGLARLVQELLELSRIESGQTRLQPEPTDTDLLIHDAAERLRAQADRAGVALRIDSATQVPAVMADRPRIEQVLINLIHNAVKFTPPGGDVTVSAVNVGDEVIFYIRDTGPGIPVEEHSRVFERFYKADRSRASSGTGLGLAIVKHIVLNHGGRIWVESTPGEGATFAFTLPVARSVMPAR